MGCAVRLSDHGSVGGRLILFRACSVPRQSAPWRLALNQILQSPAAHNSLVAGKNAGNLAESGVFRERLSRKHPRIQLVAAKFPTRPRRELFREGREPFPLFDRSREFDAKSIRAPEVAIASPRSYQLASLVLGFALSAEVTWLPVDPDNEFAQSLSVESKRASFAAGSQARSIFPYVTPRR